MMVLRMKGEQKKCKEFLSNLYIDDYTLRAPEFLLKKINHNF